MPARIITVRAKTRADLRRKIMQEIKRQTKQGMPFARAGYESRKVRKSRGLYEIEISVHS